MVVHNTASGEKMLSEVGQYKAAHMWYHKKIHTWGGWGNEQEHTHWKSQWCGPFILFRNTNIITSLPRPPATTPGWERPVWGRVAAVAVKMARMRAAMRAVCGGGRGCRRAAWWGQQGNRLVAVV